MKAIITIYNFYPVSGVRITHESMKTIKTIELSSLGCQGFESSKNAFKSFYGLEIEYESSKPFGRREDLIIEYRNQSSSFEDLADVYNEVDKKNLYSDLDSISELLKKIFNSWMLERPTAFIVSDEEIKNF